MILWATVKAVQAWKWNKKCNWLWISEKIIDDCGEMYSDISKNKPKYGEESIPRNDCIMVDKRTGYNVSNFYDTKSDTVDPTCAQFELWIQASKPVKVIL